MVKLIFTDIIVAIEADRETEVLQRSRDLSEGRRWRIFLALLPALPLSLAHMYATLRAEQYSRRLMVQVDSLFSALNHWITVVVLLIYLGLAAPRTTEAARRKAARHFRALLWVFVWLLRRLCSVRLAGITPGEGPLAGGRPSERGPLLYRALAG